MNKKEGKTTWKNIWFKTHNSIDVIPTYLESGELYCLELKIKKKQETNLSEIEIDIS